MANRQPDYRLKIMNRRTGKKCNDAGAAWGNEDRSISIVISQSIVITDSEELVITLFPHDPEFKSVKKTN